MDSKVTLRRDHLSDASQSVDNLLENRISIPSIRAHSCLSVGVFNLFNLCALCGAAVNSLINCLAPGEIRFRFCCGLHEELFE
jgi:hypothetical protein